MDIIPSDINTFGIDAKKVAGRFAGAQRKNVFSYRTHYEYGENKKALNSAIFEVQSIAQQRNCPLRRLDYQQEDGLMASVPIGINNIGIRRALTTSSTAIFVPFTTQELFRTAPKRYIAD